MHLMIYFELNDPIIGKHYNLNLEKVETWHGIIILTHITCVQKLRGLRQKLDALRVQTGPSLSKYKGFRRKHICYKEFHFSKLISTQDFFRIQHATFKAMY